MNGEKFGSIMEWLFAEWLGASYFIVGLAICILSLVLLLKASFHLSLDLGIFFGVGVVLLIVSVYKITWRKK